MGSYILLAFIAVPLIEIAVFLQIGDVIGLWWTLAVVVATAIGGTLMLRSQGLATLHRAQAHMAQGRMPLREVFDGLCLLMAGALLLTPGFVTDIAGGLLFLPPIRTLLGHTVARHFVTSGKFQGQGFTTPPTSDANRAAKTSNIIDADFEEVPPDAPPSVRDDR